MSYNLLDILPLVWLLFLLVLLLEGGDVFDEVRLVEGVAEALLPPHYARLIVQQTVGGREGGIMLGGGRGA